MASSSTGISHPEGQSWPPGSEEKQTPSAAEVVKSFSTKIQVLQDRIYFIES